MSSAVFHRSGWLMPATGSSSMMSSPSCMRSMPILPLLLAVAEEGASMSSSSERPISSATLWMRSMTSAERFLKVTGAEDAEALRQEISLSPENGEVFVDGSGSEICARCRAVMILVFGHADHLVFTLMLKPAGARFAADHVQQRGLACAIGADDDPQFVFL